jgi:putative urate catabolism protein
MAPASSFGPPRDLNGYGAKRPHANWPGGARIAVQFAINYEEGAEYSIPDGDGRTEVSLGETPGGRVPEGRRDIAFETMYEFGSRVGIWRLLRLFTERDLPFTVFGCAVALQRNPAFVSAFVEHGADICCHGLRWEEHFRLTETEERDHIAQAVALITELTGTPPEGWYCRYGPSENTRRLLVEHGGFAYDSDAYNDELPYWTRVQDASHLVVPYAMDANDAKFLMPAGFSGVDDFETYLKATFDQLYEEGADTPALMSVGLHPRIVGRPARARALAAFLDYIATFDDVWICRRIDVARHWAQVHPPTDLGT